VTIETGPDGSMRLHDRFVFLRRGLLVAAALFLGLATLGFVSGSDQLRSVWGSLAGALACGAFAAVLEDSEFEFDAGRREVRWSKRRLVGGRAGTIPFSEVANVVLDVRSSRSDSGSAITYDCRVFLVTRTTSMSLGSSNLDVAWAREGVVDPLLGLLGKNDRAVLGDVKSRR